MGTFAQYTTGQGLAIQTDGRIVVAGAYVTRCCTKRQRFAVARFNPDGTVDTSFSSDGSTTTAFGKCSLSAGYPRAWAEAVSIQPNGKIVVAGSVANGPTACGPYAEFALARYQPGGALDGSFGTGGKVTTATGYQVYGYDVAVLPAHRILAAGLRNDAQGDWNMLLAQYLAS